MHGHAPLLGKNHFSLKTRIIGCFGVVVFWVFFFFFDAGDGEGISIIPGGNHSNKRGGKEVKERNEDKRLSTRKI